MPVKSDLTENVSQHLHKVRKHDQQPGMRIARIIENANSKDLHCEVSPSENSRIKVDKSSHRRPRVVFFGIRTVSNDLHAEMLAGYQAHFNATETDNFSDQSAINLFSNSSNKTIV